MLVKRAQRQETQSLVMLKVAAAKVMLRRGVNPSLIDAMLKLGREKRSFATDPGTATLAGAAIGGLGGGVYGYMDPGEDENGKKRSRLNAMLSSGLIGAGLGGAAGGLGSLVYGPKDTKDTVADPADVLAMQKYLDKLKSNPLAGAAVSAGSGAVTSGLGGPALRGLAVLDAAARGSAAAAAQGAAASGLGAGLGAGTGAAAAQGAAGDAAAMDTASRVLAGTSVGAGGIPGGIQAILGASGSGNKKGPAPAPRASDAWSGFGRQ